MIDVSQCQALRTTITPPEWYCYGVKDPPYIHGDPNLVGCRRLGLDLSPYAGFYRAGEWSDCFGTYAFNKSKTSERLEKFLKRYRTCPYLHPERARKFLELWPDEVNVFDNEGWGYWPVTKNETIRIMADSHLIGVADQGIPNKPKCAVVKDVRVFDDFVKKLYPKRTDPREIEAVSMSLKKIQEESEHIFGGFARKAETA